MHQFWIDAALGHRPMQQAGWDIGAEDPALPVPQHQLQFSGGFRGQADHHTGLSLVGADQTSHQPLDGDLVGNAGRWGGQLVQHIPPGHHRLDELAGFADIQIFVRGRGGRHED